MDRTKGVIPEFVNPKYADEARTTFKAPTRLECMMQDYPKLLSNKGAVGLTTYPTWYVFSPVKNNVKDGAALMNKGLPSFGAAQGEYDFYNWTNNVLEKVVGVKIERQTESEEYAGIRLAYGPKILLDPTFALTLRDLRAKFVGENKISKNSTLVLKGLDSKVENLDLDGYLRVEGGATISGTQHNGDFFEFTKTTEADPEVFRIRGFVPRLVKH